MYLQTHNSLEAFETNTRVIPILSAEDTYNLTVDYYNNKSIESAEKLVVHNLRYVYSIVMSRYHKYRHVAMDLIQEGTIGLMQSVKRFDPHKNVKFLSYATMWITSYINRYLYGNATVVRRLSAAGSGHKTPKDISTNYCEVNYDDCDLHDEASTEEFVVNKIALERLKNIIDKLKFDDKDYTILNDRILSDAPLTLQEVADKFNVTRESIRQKEQTIIRKIRRELNDT